MTGEINKCNRNKSCIDVHFPYETARLTTTLIYRHHIMRVVEKRQKVSHTTDNKSCVKRHRNTTTYQLCPGGWPARLSRAPKGGTVHLDTWLWMCEILRLKIRRAIFKIHIGCWFVYWLQLFSTDVERKDRDEIQRSYQCVLEYHINHICRSCYWKHIHYVLIAINAHIILINK